MTDCCDLVLKVDRIKSLSYDTIKKNWQIYNRTGYKFVQVQDFFQIRKFLCSATATVHFVNIAGCLLCALRHNRGNRLKELPLASFCQYKKHA